MKRLIKNPEIICKDVDDEKVLLNPQTGEYYGINEVGAEIWTMVNGENDISVIVQNLVRIYEVDRQTLEADVAEFLSALIERNIIKEE